MNHYIIRATFIIDIRAAFIVDTIDALLSNQ
jgi:hypothetical protein